MTHAIKAVLAAILLALGAFASSAQEPTPALPTQSFIGIGETVEDTILNAAVFDLWEFSALTGDVLRIEMVGSDGLAPLIGIRSAAGNILARSDLSEDGTVTDAPVNGVAVLEYTIPEEETYVIIATRAGLANGTTEGSYTLTLSFADEREAPARENLLQPVTFRCGETLATTAATIAFDEPRDSMVTVSISVYGLDGFDPVIQQGRDGQTECLEPTPLEAAITLPDGTQYTQDEVLSVTYTLDASQPVYLTLGTRGELTGRYLVLIDGFLVDAQDDQDALFLRLGPRAIETELHIYMLNSPRARLDPVIELVRQEEGTVFRCDDAGRFDCDHIDAATGYHIEMGEEGVRGGRLDAGAVIATGDDTPTAAALSSANNATGPYFILLVGGIIAADAR